MNTQRHDQLTSLGFAAVYLALMSAMIVVTTDRLAALRHVALLFVCLPAFVVGAGALLLGCFTRLDTDISTQ